MSTGQHPAPRRNARPYSVDEGTIRTRSANPDAAEYTLYVRGLINDYLGVGGQAKILEHAHNRGLHYPGLNRQKLSEQLSRYRLGPTWEMTELIIACLPNGCHTAGIRALAAGWYQCARGHLPHGLQRASQPPSGQARPAQRPGKRTCHPGTATPTRPPAGTPSRGDRAPRQQPADLGERPEPRSPPSQPA
ncbi:hypothetical protein ACIBEF_31840 [Micromonospora sp. NPDC050795]|uniref:hypothetical protein n=1 Tax=Micromonospora sp. NPDC050795 TaxID=3364282 RepID=UPI0037958301